MRDIRLDTHTQSTSAVFRIVYIERYKIGRRGWEEATRARRDKCIDEDREGEWRLDMRSRKLFLNLACSTNNLSVLP